MATVACGGEPEPNTPTAHPPDLAPMRGGFRRCYKAALDADTDTEGRVVVRVEVAGDGTIVSAEPRNRSGNLTDATVECIVAVVRLWRPAPIGYTTWRDFPVTLKKR
jgi:hypothetical protein